MAAVVAVGLAAALKAAFTVASAAAVNIKIVEGWRRW